MEFDAYEDGRIAPRRPDALNFRPMPAPNVGIFDSPTHCVQVNTEWVSYLLELIRFFLADDRAWQGTKEQRYAAVEQIELFLTELASEGSCSVGLKDVRLNAQGVLIKELSNGTIEEITPVVQDARVFAGSIQKQVNGSWISIGSFVQNIRVFNGYLQRQLNVAWANVARYVSDVVVRDGNLELSRAAVPGTEPYETIMPYLADVRLQNDELQKSRDNINYEAYGVISGPGGGIEDVRLLDDGCLEKMEGQLWVEAGCVPVISDVNVFTLPPGSQASGEISNGVLNLFIPQGEQGETGSAGMPIPNTPAENEENNICGGCIQLIEWVIAQCNKTLDEEDLRRKGIKIAMDVVVAIAEALSGGILELVPVDEITGTLWALSDLQTTVLRNKINDIVWKEEIYCNLYCSIKSQGGQLTEDIWNDWKASLPDDLVNGEKYAKEVIAMVRHEAVAARYWVYATEPEADCQAVCTECESDVCDWVQTWDLVNWEINPEYANIISGSYSYGNGYIGAPRPSSNGKIYNNMQLNILRPDGFTGEFNYIKMTFDIFAGGTTADSTSPPIRLYNDSTLEFESAGYADFSFGTDKIFQVDLDNRTSSLYAITASPNAWLPGGIQDGYVVLKALEICGTDTNPFILG